MDDHHLNFITKMKKEEEVNKHQLIVQKSKMNLLLGYENANVNLFFHIHVGE